MKDFRFYLEFPDPKTKKRSGKNHVGNSGSVIAIVPETLAQRMDGKYDAVGGVFDHANSQPASTSASTEYIRTMTKRIPERLARQIHPALFEYLDAA